MTENCDISDLKLSNYNFVNCPSHSKHTGGVCVYINKKFRFNNISVINNQFVWLLSFEIVINKKSNVFACIYLSSNNENKNSTLEFVEKWLNDISAKKQFMLCGDFNIDILTQTTHSRRLRNICDDNGTKLIVESPTRITENTATLIDLCATNINVNKISCKVLIEDQISDHSIIEIVVHGSCETVSKKIRKVRVWQNWKIIYIRGMS